MDFVFSIHTPPSFAKATDGKPGLPFVDFFLRKQKGAKRLRRMPSKAILRSLGEGESSCVGGQYGTELNKRRISAELFEEQNVLTYILRSLSYPDQRYIGSTSDLKARLTKHNEGGVPHTAKFRPWKIESYFAFETKEKAAAFEAYLKSGSGYAFANRHFWFSAKPSVPTCKCLREMVYYCEKLILYMEK